jgi:D-proline reductase (dithiol) PrdB
VLARILENEGLSTILVTNMPFWVERIGVPRTLAVEFPFGHILGEPHQYKQQMEVLQEALEFLANAHQPGLIKHSQQTWPVESEVAMKDWQPLEPSPVISHMSGKLREQLRVKRKGIKEED